jgi:hypothetical protein
MDKSKCIVVKFSDWFLNQGKHLCKRADERDLINYVQEIG